MDIFKKPQAPFWTPAEDKILIADWPTGNAAEIGKRLGRTRNSVIGRAKRLKLPKKQEGFDAAARLTKKLASNPNYVPPAPRPPKVVKVTIRPLAIVPTAEEAIPLLEAGVFQCKALMPGVDKYGLAKVCGRPVQEGRYYEFCEYHMSKFVQKRSA